MNFRVQSPGDLGAERGADLLRCGPQRGPSGRRDGVGRPARRGGPALRRGDPALRRGDRLGAN